MNKMKLAVMLGLLLISFLSLDCEVYADQAGTRTGTNYLPKNRVSLLKLSIAELRLAVDQLGKGSKCPDCGAVPPIGSRNVDKELKAQNAILATLDEFLKQSRQTQALYNRYAQQLRQLKAMYISPQEVEKQLAGLDRQFDRALQTEAKMWKGYGTQFIPEIQQRQLDILASKPALVEFASRTISGIRAMEQTMHGLLQSIDKLHLLILNEINRQNPDGYTLLARALIYDNKALTDWLLEYSHEPVSVAPTARTKWEAEGLLSKELMKAAARSDTETLASLLACGAKVDQPYGSYNGLAYAKAFRDKKLEHLLVNAGAELRVPWNDELDKGIKSRLKILEGQLTRVSSFAGSVGYETPQSVVPDYHNVFDIIRCKINCLRQEFL